MAPLNFPLRVIHFFYGGKLSEELGRRRADSRELEEREKMNLSLMEGHLGIPQGGTLAGGQPSWVSKG